MPLSPKTDYAMQGGQGPQDAEAIFEERFGQLAENHLITKHPELAEMILMFTVVNTDLENDLGVGTFVLDIGGNEVHVPVVSDRGRIAPVDMMYSKSYNTFLPLSKEWLEYLMSETDDQLGAARKPPSTLQTDVDIRNLVVPPMTGRYSYASAPVPADLMDVLTALPNQVKQAFIVRLQGSRKLATHVLTRYGQQRLTQATLPIREKRATAARLSPVEIYDVNTSAVRLQNVFGADLPMAYHSMRKHGYALVDRRPDPKLAYFKEYIGRYSTPESAGYYEVTMRDGETQHAYITTAPVRMGENQRYAQRATPRARSIHGSPAPLRNRSEVFAFTEKGELLYSRGMALPVVTVGDNEQPDDKRKEKIFNAKALGRPKKGKGFFVGFHGMAVTVTEPVTIEEVTLRSDGTYILQAHCQHGVSIVVRMGPDSPSVIHVGDYGDTPQVRVPNDYHFVSTPKQLDSDMMCTDPREVRRIEEEGWRRNGATEVSVIEKAGSYAVDSCIMPSRVATVRHLIVDYDLTAGSAERLVKMAGFKGRSVALVIGRPALLKMAAGEAPMPPGAEQDPAMQEDPAMQDPAMQDPAMQDPAMQDPAMQDPAMMDPAMMPPSPLEQAATDISSVLEAQTQEVMAQMQQQASLFEAQVQAINMMLGRAEEIAQGAPPLEYGDIRAHTQSTVPQAMPVEGVPPGGMPGGMPGEMPGGMPGGMPPDPTGMGMTEGPMGGDMLETAADVESEFPESDAFDTSAIASLVAEDGLEDMAAEQLPKFREALDGIAKTLFEMRIKAPMLRPEIGEQRYTEITSQLRKVMTAFGSVLLSLYRNSQILVPADQQQREAM